MHPDDLHRLHRRVPRYKAPLLKALEAVNKAAVDVCHYFNPDVKKVYAYLGWEQEYFLVDEPIRRTSRSVDDRPNLDGT